MHLLKTIYHKLLHFFRFVSAYGIFIRDYSRYKMLQRHSKKRFAFSWKLRYPRLNDKRGASPDIHYLYHTAWAARILQKLQPEIHHDFSSSLYFNLICSAFMKINYYDFHPERFQLSNLTEGQADVTKLPFPDHTLSSVSCMHVVEHIGLGRYGDSLDSEGDLKAITELNRVLAPGGNLLFVVPLSKIPVICFNAHRLYTYQQIIDYFNELTLIEFALIPDQTTSPSIIYNPSPQICGQQQYACGCFWFRK